MFQFIITKAVRLKIFDEINSILFYQKKISLSTLSTSSQIFLYLKGDPIILYNKLYPQIQGNKDSLRA